MLTGYEIAVEQNSRCLEVARCHWRWPEAPPNFTKEVLAGCRQRAMAKVTAGLR